jgi:hypothetical protein
MLQGAQLIAALRKIATISMNSTLVRNVPLFALIDNQPLQFSILQENRTDSTCPGQTVFT